MPKTPRPASPPCIIDVEASGFGRGSYPIEIGFVLADGLAWCTLVQPAPDWTHWDTDAERVHGLSREHLLAHGRPLKDVAQTLNAKLGDQTIYSDAWSHDYTWLNVLFDTAGVPMRFKLAHMRSLLTEEQADQLATAKIHAATHLQLERHRASADARVLQLAVMQLLGITG